MATTNKVKGWPGVLMTEDSSSHWPIKRRYVYSETSRRAGLEFVCIFGHDAVVRWRADKVAVARPEVSSDLKEAINELGARIDPVAKNCPPRWAAYGERSRHDINERDFYSAPARNAVAPRSWETTCRVVDMYYSRKIYS